MRRERGRRGWIIVGICLALVACSPWQDSYLKEATDTATQTAVRKRLGPPHEVDQRLLDEETTWVYRYAMTQSELHPGRPSTMLKGATDASAEAAAMIKGGGPTTSAEKLTCIRYVLTFDKTHVLRKWKREEC
jgi:hypothetical protein